MVVRLRVHRAELQVVLRQKSLTVDRLGRRVLNRSMPIRFARRIVAIGTVFLWLHEGIKVENQRLQILRTLLQLPDLLVTARLVVQYTYYYVLVYRLAATRSVLQNLLGLSQVHQGLLRTVIVNTLLGVVTQLNHPL